MGQSLANTIRSGPKKSSPQRRGEAAPPRTVSPKNIRKYSMGGFVIRFRMAL